MLQKPNRCCAIVVLVCFGSAAGPVVHADTGCPCEVDVTNDGVFDLNDVSSVESCARGDCSYCVVSCDVNCDGVVDRTDFGVAVCAFWGNTDCCNRPVGACRVSGGDPNTCHGRCAVMPEVSCGLFQPAEATWQYYGDGSDCSVPTVSEWGMVVMSLVLLIAGVTMVRHLHAPTLIADSPAPSGLRAWTGGCITATPTRR